MRCLLAAAVMWGMLASTRAAGFWPLEDTTSPDGKFALAAGEGPLGWDYIWRVTLPALTPLGAPFICKERIFIGLPSRSYAEWNPRAHRVALAQGGITFEEVKVFQYSSAGLQELRFPDLEDLPARWYAHAHVDRTYIEPVRWIGRNRLRMLVGGSLKYGDGTAPRFYDYEFRFTIHFRRDGTGTIEHLSERPLKGSD